MPNWALYDSNWDWKAFLDQSFATIVGQKARDLVIDLRENEGGLGVGDDILSHLIAIDLPAEPVTRRVRYRRVPNDLVPHLDTWDRSFLDWGAFFFLRLPRSGLELDLPLIGQFPDGERPDAGLEPDVLVVPTVSDIAGGRDAEMNAVRARNRRRGGLAVPAERRARAASSIASRASRNHGLLRFGFRRQIRRGSWRVGVPFRVHGQRLSMVLIDGPLADRTASQSPRLGGMRGEQIAAGLPSASVAHVKWSDGSCVKVARPVARSLTSAASWPGSLSLQPCARSFETQNAEPQYTLFRPACSRA